MRSSFFFDSIVIPVPKEKIYRRLGYRKGMTRLHDREREDTERVIDEAADLIRLKGVAARLVIAEKKAGETVLAGGKTVRSRSVARLLRNSEEILLMGATAGRDIMEAIATESSRDHLTHGVILDAAASEIVDGALNWIMALLNQELRREGRHLTKRRFSAGYGDFLLYHQEWIYQELGLDRLGVQINRSFMLVPEKSVTALAGIEKVLNG